MTTMGGLSGRRIIGGTVLAVAGLTIATTSLVPVRETFSLAGITLVYLACVVTVAAVGGVWPGLAAAIVSDVMVNYFFVPPYHTFDVDGPDDVVTLVVYIAVAVGVAVAVDLAARQRASAARRGVEAALLARIGADPIGEGSVAALLEHVRGTLGMTGVALLENGVPVAFVGERAETEPTLTVDGSAGITLAAYGPEIFAADPRFLTRLADTIGRALQTERLAAQAARSRELAEIDRLRAALLAAVGHDLRTPLAGTKAAVSSLRDPDLAISGEHADELLRTIEESTDRMSALVENLLAMSRLQAGALSVSARPVALDEMVASALLHLPDVAVDVPEDLPLALADPGLTERVIVNLADNARRAGPPVRVTASADGDRLRLRVIDHGPGVPDADKPRMFSAFQRLGDHTADGGLGLGLAIAQGFTEAMGGTLEPGDTPGGGLTMTITLPTAAS